MLPFAFWKQPSNWPTGADGALSINGTNTQIPAGSIKDYSSISIINGGALEIVGALTLGLGVNDGHLPTLIGCSGNCTINTGGQILCKENAGVSTDYYNDTVYSAPTIPAGCVVNPIEYTRYGSFGTSGGETGGYGTIAGTDAGVGIDTLPTGHGGGGAGYTDGQNTTDEHDWGTSGNGGSSTIDGGPGYVYPGVHGFGANGIVGLGGETPTGISVGGGGSGGLRGLSGGCVYLQIAGTANIDANSIAVNGSNGGNGGAGGVASSPDDAAVGGGGGGGGAGGSGGAGIIRYKTGSVHASAVIITAGSGGTGGAGGWGDPSSPGGGTDGFPGGDGGAGVDGVSDIATY